MALAWVLSELESLGAQPNSALRWRKYFLKLMNVQYSQHLWVGRHLTLLNYGRITLGERCALGNRVMIENHGALDIGDDFIGSSGLTIGSGTHDPRTLQPQKLSVKIGDRVWCGFNVTILAGVTIGDDVVIGAGSLVCRDIPDNSVAVGIPCQVIKSLERTGPTWTWVAGAENPNPMGDE